MKGGRTLGLAILLVLVAGCGEHHGFIKIGSNVLFAPTDRLECGEAKIVPQPNGLIDAFVTLAPQDCVLTLRKTGDFLGFGTKLCTLHVGNNRLTTVYLSESRDGIACDIGS